MSNEVWPNSKNSKKSVLLLVLLPCIIYLVVLIGIEFIPFEIWVLSGRVIVQRCNSTQIVVTVNTLNRYRKIMLRHISDKWVVTLLMVVMWIVVVAVADMNWPSHMGDQNVLVDAIFGKLS